MLYLSKKDVAKILNIDNCINIMRETLENLSLGDIQQPLRTAMRLGQENILGVMPSQIYPANIFGTKIISVFPENHHIGMPSHQGIVLLFNNKDGKLEAIVDGMQITSIRTAAVSAVATEVLSRKNSHVLTLIGAGTQAKTHLEAMLKIRDIKVIKVWDYYSQNAIKFAKINSEKHRVKIEAYDNVKDAVENADIICTVSLAKEPIINYEWLKQGVHINAVGACTAKDRELDSNTIINSKFYVDRKESTVNEAGCYIIPLKQRLISSNHIKGEVGELLLGKVKGREHENEITVFKSLGLAVEDLAAANYIYETAKQQGIGVLLES